MELTSAFKKAAEGKLKGILGVEKTPLVSVDYKQSPFSSVVDLPLTMAKDGLVKVVAWYDNEWAYTCRLIEMATFISL